MGKDRHSCSRSSLEARQRVHTRALVSLWAFKNLQPVEPPAFTAGPYPSSRDPSFWASGGGTALLLKPLTPIGRAFRPSR